MQTLCVYFCAEARLCLHDLFKIPARFGARSLPATGLGTYNLALKQA